MKTNRLIAILSLATILSVTPAFAQGRGGGGSRGGSSSSRSSSSFSGSSSRSSSSSSSRSSFSGSSSRSSSPSSSRSSYSSSPSRSSSPSSSRSSYSSSPSRSSSPSSSRSYSSSPSRRSSSSSDRSNAVSTSSSRGGSATFRGENGTPKGRDDNNGPRGNFNHNNRSSVGTPASSAPTRSGRVNTPGTTTNRPTGSPDNRQVNEPGGPNSHYARPGHPGVMPPSHRPMHPAPYFHHPYHHGMIHMHPIFWHPLPPRPLFWPGFWLYCNSYWYDYHVTDVTVVHRYVKETYNVDMVSYAMSGDLMYAIVNDNGTTYLQVYDNEDKLLAEHEISHKYIKTEIDRENGGCWIFKKRDKDPMLFLYAEGELLIYEAD